MIDRSVVPQIFRQFFIIILLAIVPGACTNTTVHNPCLSEYPDISIDTQVYPSGIVASIKEVEWFEEGVKQLTLKTGGVLMFRPGDLAMPKVGSNLELRSFTKQHGEAPFAGCYCETGTDVCLEEYAYP